MGLQVPSFTLPVPSMVTGTMLAHSTFLLNEEILVKCDVINVSFSNNITTKIMKHCQILFPQTYLLKANIFPH